MTTDTDTDAVRYAIVRDRGYYGSGETVRPLTTHSTLRDAQVALRRRPKGWRVIEYDPEWIAEWLGHDLDRFPTAQ